MKRYAIALLLGSTLAACSSKPMITDIDVQNHQKAGDLLSLYESMQDEIKVIKPETDLAVNRQLYIEKTGRLIAEEKEQKILDGLDRQFGKHSILALRMALAKAADIQLYDEKVYSELHRQFEQAISQKKGVILSKEAEYYELTDIDALKKVGLLDEIITIYGEQSAEAEQVKSQRKIYIDGLFQSAQQAMIDKKYDVVNVYIKNVEAIQPDYPSLQDIHKQLLVAEYEQQFWDALENGQTDKAYATFYKLTQIPDYMQAHPDIQPIAEDMAQFFLAEGEQSFKDKAIDQAYIAYSRSSYIKNSIGKTGSYSMGEKKFIDHINKRFKSMLMKSQIIPAYGALLVLAELMPEHPSVIQYQQQLHDAVVAEARVKIISTAFSATANEGSLAQSLGKKINEILLEGASRLIDLLDGADAVNAYSAAKVLTMPNSDAYYILSGELLGATLTQQEEAQNTSRKVITGYLEEPNPAYMEWQDLSKSKQKESPMPPEILTKAIEQNVVLPKTVITQNARVAIKFRVASAVSASVLFSDSVTTKKQHIAENISGVKVGSFVQEEKLGVLLDEKDMLEKLLTKTAAITAEKIVKQFEHLPDQYSKSADDAVVLEKFKLATIRYAYSYVLSDAETMSNYVSYDKALTNFKIYALRWK